MMLLGVLTFYVTRIKHDQKRHAYEVTVTSHAWPGSDMLIETNQDVNLLSPSAI